MSGTRIDFLKGDAAAFNELRDKWRGAASSCSLSKSALRVANVLPRYVNREFGYAFVTDMDLATEISGSAVTIKRGLAALEKKHLIERVTKVKRDDKGEAIGRLRRIYLSMPEVKGQTPEKVKGQKVNGQPEVKGQNRACERSYGGPNIPDQDIPDTQIRSGERRLGSYARTRTPARPNPYPAPAAYAADPAFLAAFDRCVSEIAGDEIGAGEIDRITCEAFDLATDSSELFMPFHWKDVLAIRSDSSADWFRYRASGLIHRREAA